MHCPAYSRFCQSRLLRLWSSWLLGISKNGNSAVFLGDLLKRNSCTLSLQFHLAIGRKKAIERNLIALKCCCIRYSTFCVSVNNVKEVCWMAFLSLQQTILTNSHIWIEVFFSVNKSAFHHFKSKTKKTQGIFWGLDFSFY